MRNFSVSSTIYQTKARASGTLRSDNRGGKVQTLVVMRFLCRLVALLLFTASLLHAEPPAKLRVGIFDRPPFAIKDASGHWSGLAVDMWEQVSGDLGLSYEYVETPCEKIIAETASGRLDLAMGEISISSDRARLVEFSQPYLMMPAAVALPKGHRAGSGLQFLRELLTHDEVGIMILILLGSLVLFSIVLWLVERRVESTHFGGHPLRGFGSALWFAAVTMTTVGYGDKTPQSAVGRAVVLFWMFLGVVLISVFTGAVASSLSVASLDQRINRASDLAHYRTGVMDGSLAQNFLSSVGVTSRGFPSLETGLKALATGQISAFADSEESLRYLVNRDYPGEITVDPVPGTRLVYAFAARPGFPPATLKAINIELIDRTSQPDWQQQLERWIGPATH